MNFQRLAGQLLGSDLEILMGNGRRQNLGGSISEGVSGVLGEEEHLGSPGLATVHHVQSRRGNDDD
jgi:hypothetical protein